MAGHYGKNKELVASFLNMECEVGNIKNLNHCEVYNKIESELGLDILKNIICN